MGYEQYIGQRPNSTRAQTNDAPLSQPSGNAQAESPMSQSVGHLVECVASLERMLDDTERRLEPVMSPAPPAGDRKEEPVPSCGAAVDALNATSARLRYALYRLQGIHERLSV